MKIKKFIDNNIVLLAAIIIAITSCFFVLPDEHYMEYFDYRTLMCLFLMSLIICSLRNIMFFRILAKKIVIVFKNTRTVITALILITYIGSMLIANDMALITFLPLGVIVLKSTNKEKYMIYTFIMQNIAANLGGMITPFGNPQNLYLYNYFHIDTLEFIKIMLLPTIVAFVLLMSTTFFIKKEPLTLDIEEYDMKLDKKRTIIYFILFAYAIIIIFRLVPYWTGLIVVPIILFLDHHSIRQVDYSLLLTFCMFFVFTGNIARIPNIQIFLSDVADNTLLTGVLSCQVISNVPTAILLSNFTENYAQLLRAVNIAGCGTLISSMASLITFKIFIKEQKENTFKYLLWFSIVNFSFLIILFATCLI